jgi:Putative metallopeptidase
MYRWSQHRGARWKRRLRDARNLAGSSFDRPYQRSHLRQLIVDRTTRGRRALALSSLVLFAISSVGSWYLPAARRPDAEALSIQRGGAPAASKTNAAKSFIRYGFTLQVQPRYKARRSLLLAESESQVKSLISLLNETIELPAEVGFSFEECIHSNVYYDEDTNQVVICRQWLDEIERVLSRDSSDKTAVRQTVQNVALAVFLHETAHALIDILGIPVTGRDEDAADQFSTLILLNQKDGARKALLVAHVYKVLSQDEARYPPVYWGEHSLDIQRYYDTLCMIYGRDPKQNLRVLANDPLPEARAENCESEYKRIESSWKKLLMPYAKDSLWQPQ